MALRSLIVYNANGVPATFVHEEAGDGNKFNPASKAYKEPGGVTITVDRATYDSFYAPDVPTFLLNVMNGTIDAVSRSDPVLGAKVAANIVQATPVVEQVAQVKV